MAVHIKLIKNNIKVTELQDILKQKLTEGQTVVLPGIGRFSLRVESIGVDDPKASKPSGRRALNLKLFKLVILFIALYSPTPHQCTDARKG